MEAHSAPISTDYKLACRERAKRVFEQTIIEMEHQYKSKINSLEFVNKVLKQKLQDTEENLDKALKENEYKQAEIKMLRAHQNI